LQPTDRELVERFVQQRDEEAFRLLFRRHTPRLYAIALRLMAQRASDAEDAVQTAWQRASTRLASFEWRSQFGTWLTAIVINCARERLRTRMWNAEAPLEDDFSSHDRGPGATAIDLERAIAALPDGYREVLVLHDVEGMTHTEIAEHLGIAAGTSKSQLFHARRRVRALLSPSGLREPVAPPAIGRLPES
jgi:RNA polymerase sigma-70 factor (ECF subfamily)